MVSPASIRFDPPTHVVLRSADQSSSNLAGYVAASSRAEGFALLEIRERDGTTDGVSWAGLVPAERHMVAFAPRRHAGGAASTEGGWPVVRADQPDRVISHLLEFLVSPEAATQLLRQRLALRRSLPILVANGGFMARQFPDNPADTARIMQVQKQFGISVILAADETPRQDYSAFDYVFDVLPSEGGLGRTKLRCARAPVGAGLRSGDEFTLAQLDGFEALARRWESMAPPVRHLSV